jgi:hypothetical protein
MAFSRIDEAVHIFPSDLSVGPFGGCDVIVLRDNLIWGPCDPDPTRHAELRRAFWLEWHLERTWALSARLEQQYHDELVTELFSAFELAAALSHYPEDRSVVLWTVAAWMERLSLWWMLDAIRQAGLNRERFWIAQPQQDDSGAFSLGCVCSERLTEAFANRIRLSAGMLQSGASLWQKYSAASPRAFDAMRRKGSKWFPDLASVAELNGWFFPQVNGSRSARLRLSKLDQFLFQSLQVDAWVRPYDYFVDRRFCDEFLYRVGDLSLTTRLREWANHQSDEPVLSSQEQEGVNYLTNVAYRLTRRGERMRDRGLERADEAPALFVGGCRVYSGANPWVRRNRGRDWSIERLR